MRIDPLFLLICAIIAPSVLIAEPCDKTTPGASADCGSAQACEDGNWFAVGCSGTFIESKKYVHTCDGPEGTCSQKCGSHGSATCTESFECTEGESFGEEGGVHCVKGDPILDGEGDPVISTSDKMGAVTCEDTCE